MAAHATGHPRFFSRNLAVLGAAIGVLYLAVMTLGAQVVNKPPWSVPDVMLLAADASPQSACGAAVSPRTIAASNTITTSYGSEPQRFVVTARDAVPDAVLAIGSLVDAAELARCEGTVLVETNMRAGDSVAFSVRPMKTAEIAFPVGPVRAGDRFVLTITQNALISTDIYLQEKSVFERSSQRRLMTHLFLLGAVSGLILYNTALSYVARNATFLFNALTIASMLVLDLYLSGLGAAYLWPDQPWLSNVVLGVALAGPSLFAPFYLYSFLENRPLSAFPDSPLYWIWPAASLAGLALMPVMPLWPIYQFHTALWIASALVFLAVIVRRTRAGSERAGILALPVLGAILPAMAIAILKEFAGYDFGVLGEHATEIVMVAEALLFTFALAYLLRLSQYRENAALEAANRMARSVNTRLMQTLDSERTHVASELHDTAGQGVVLIVNRLKALAANPRLNTALRTDVAGIERLSRDMLSEIRSISHSLHPAILDHLGFERAAAALAENLSKANSQTIEVDLPPEQMPLTANQALQLYRIVQELLTNALTHAGATSVRLSLGKHGDARILTVADDGRGIDEGGARPDGAGMGMRILAQRVASLPGEMTVDSGTDGTRVSVRFVPGSADGENGSGGTAP